MKDTRNIIMGIIYTLKILTHIEIVSLAIDRIIVFSVFTLTVNVGVERDVCFVEYGECRGN